jgi:hypothetical protein
MRWEDEELGCSRFADRREDESRQLAEYSKGVEIRVLKMRRWQRVKTGTGEWRESTGPGPVMVSVTVHTVKRKVKRPRPHKRDKSKNACMRHLEGV